MNTNSSATRALQLLRGGGIRSLGMRAARVAYQRLGASALEFPLLPGDIADSARLSLPKPAAHVDPGRPLVIGWLTTPPGLGSGGHTTMFRMVQALEEAGHTCVMYLYDRYGGDLERHRAVIRSGWPFVRADVRDVSDGIRDVDGCVATSWQTAHVLASRPVITRRFYFVQDFEPFFYARGSEYALAEDTYRFGFRCISIGHMVADLLRECAGVEADVVEFGCDTDMYRYVNDGSRNGVVFYTKPDVSRRGYILGALALEEFSTRHPEQNIHVFGDRTADLAFPAIHHAKLRPVEINELYNRTIAGLAMSFTNISLVAEEMLASGTIPVINDSAYARADLDSSAARWAQATPGAIADALSDLVTAQHISDRARRAASSIRRGNWRPGKQAFVAAIESEIYGARLTSNDGGIPVPIGSGASPDR